MVAAIIVVAVSNLFFVNLKEGKFTESRFDALMIAQEGMEAIKSVSESSWQNIYLPPAGNGNKDNKGENFIYCIKSEGSSWLLTDIISDCNIISNSRTYTRKIIIDNVKRDGGNISESIGSDDPSTQKIKVVVSYADGKDVVLEQYLTRWKNRILKQDSWSAAPPSGQTECETLSGTWDPAKSLCSVELNNPANETGWNSYDDLDNGSGRLDTSAGSLKFK